MELVAGRECGECTVCCTVAPIRTATLVKAPSTPCPHCTAGGCGIYLQRPDECRDSFCGWRARPELDAGWRPDLSGVMILAEHDAPPPMSGRPGLKFVLVDGDEPIRTDRFIGYVTALIRREVPVALSVQGPPGHWPVKTFLNQALTPAIRRMDTDEIRRVLERQVAVLRAGAFERADL